jgi:flavin prenyltransferase
MTETALSPDLQRLVIAITGSSGSILGIRLLEILQQSNIETHLIISRAAEKTLFHETGRKLNVVSALANKTYDVDDIGAAIASGSYKTSGMIVAPCSIKTLSAVANSYADNLIARAADVTLKESRPLLLAVRETPYHRGHIRLMDLAASAGAIIFPPVPAFYSLPQSMNEVIDQIAGRMLARIGLDNDYYQPWTGLEPIP